MRRQEKERLFGMEESYGGLIGTYARDKDAISATAAPVRPPLIIKKRE